VRDLSDIELHADEFNELRLLCMRDRDFPPDFAAWCVLMERASADARARNLEFEPLLLDVAEFSRWCQRLKIMPCLDALRAFAIVRRRTVIELGAH